MFMGIFVGHNAFVRTHLTGKSEALAITYRVNELFLMDCGIDLFCRPILSNSSPVPMMMLSMNNK